MTLDETKQLIFLLSGAYPNAQVSEATVVAYHVGLEDLDYDYVRNVALRHIHEEKWFPSISELRGPSDVPDDPQQLLEQKKLARGTLAVFGPVRAKEILGEHRFKLLLGDDPAVQVTLAEVAARELGE